MNRKLTLAIFMVFAFAAVSSVNAQTISLSVGNGTINKGSTKRAYVVMEIPKGLHVNSNRPKSEYAIPTRVTVEASGVTIGAVSYPPGKMKRFSFSDEPISIYEGRVVFGFNVTVPRGFRGRTFRLKADVRFQPCTDEVCYPPRTKTVELTVRVR